MRYPEEIEDDLLAYRNLDIGLWHRLTINPLTGGPYLSSRRLLVLLEGLDDEGRYKKATRGGRQTRKERVQEETYNEIAILRSSYHTVNTEDGKGYYEPAILRDPVDEAEKARRDAEKAEQAEKANQDFESQMGFT